MGVGRELLLWYLGIGQGLRHRYGAQLPVRDRPCLQLLSHARSRGHLLELGVDQAGGQVLGK